MFLRSIGAAFVVLALALAATGCKGKPTGMAAATSPALVDLSTSLDAVRTAFNAHDKEARFLTLLSPA
jgi:hypothetical protein